MTTTNSDSSPPNARVAAFVLAATLLAGLVAAYVYLDGSRPNPPPPSTRSDDATPADTGPVRRADGSDTSDTQSNIARGCGPFRRPRPSFPDPAVRPSEFSHTDHTSALHSALRTAANQNGTLRLETGRTYTISETLAVESVDRLAIDGAGATIRVAGEVPDDSGPALLIEKSSHLFVADLTVDGNREARSPTGTAGGHNIRVRDGDSIRFYDVTSVDSTGDGWYLGAADPTAPATYPTDVQLQNCVARRNYRQGLSIINGRDLRIVDSTFAETAGTPPSAGIDLEPNGGSASPGITDVAVCGSRFVDNAGAGIYSRSAHAAIRRITIAHNRFRGNASADVGDRPWGAALWIEFQHSLVHHNEFTPHGPHLARGLLHVDPGTDVVRNVLRHNTFTAPANSTPAITVAPDVSGRQYIIDNTFPSAHTRPVRAPSNTCTANNEPQQGPLGTDTSACNPLASPGYRPTD